MANKLILSGFLVGALGDAFLQSITMDNRHGLQSYFNQHGKVESVMLGSMITGMWTYAYTLTKLNSKYLPIYGLFLDEWYRQSYHIVYPSLKDYYQSNSRPKTLLYNAIVGGLIWIMNDFIF